MRVRPEWFERYEDRWDLLSLSTPQVPVGLASCMESIAEITGLPKSHPWQARLPRWDTARSSGQYCPAAPCAPSRVVVAPRERKPSSTSRVAGLQEPRPTFTGLGPTGVSAGPMQQVMQQLRLSMVRFRCPELKRGGTARVSKTLVGPSAHEASNRSTSARRANSRRFAGALLAGERSPPCALRQRSPAKASSGGGSFARHFPRTGWWVRQTPCLSPGDSPPHKCAGVPTWIWDGETLPVSVEHIADSHFGLLVRDVDDLAAAPVAPEGHAGQTLSGVLLPGPGPVRSG